MQQCQIIVDFWHLPGMHQNLWISARSKLAKQKTRLPTKNALEVEEIPKDNHLSDGVQNRRK